MRTSKAILVALALGASQFVQGQSPEPHNLCQGNETTLWTCETRTKTYSLCASKEIDTSNGYIQYRAGTSLGLEFSFPAKSRHPYGLFQYSMYLNGNAAVTFSNGNYKYDIVDPLRDRSAIYVTKQTGDRRAAMITCTNANQSLQLNSNMALMKSAGLYEP